jgi:replicative DNA helicase
MAIYKETRLMLFNGSIKSAAELTHDDILMGDDSKPRKIIKLEKVKSNGVEVLPSYGEPLKVSAEQLITFKKARYLSLPYRHVVGGKVKFKIRYRTIPSIISLKAIELPQLSKKFRKCFMLLKTAVHFEKKPVNIDPYFLGIWLGDGNAHNLGITTLDSEIINYVHTVSRQYSLHVNVNTKAKTKASTYTITRGNLKGYGIRKNPLKTLFQSEDLLFNKHIPKRYLINSIEVRKNLLAGIIDTDGYTARNIIYISQKSERLIKEIQYLANTLGFRCTLTRSEKGIKSLGFKATYFHLTITGDLNSMPTRLKRKQTNIKNDRYDRKQVGYKVNPIEEHEMIEITVDENGRFLRDDCMIIGGLQSHFEK